jgi:hypothetical protein
MTPRSPFFSSVTLQSMGGGGRAGAHQLQEVAATTEDGLLDGALHDPVDQGLGALGSFFHPLPPVVVRRPGARCPLHAEQ